MHKSREHFHSTTTPRKDILSRLAHDCKMLQGDPREVLLCFSCDPYPKSAITDEDVTRQALRILALYKMKATVLTKAGMRAVRDFDILKQQGWSFGTSLVWASDLSRAKFEPNASPVSSRAEAIRFAHSSGIRTWVSLEPVISPVHARAVIADLIDVVDHWKIGKINHCQELEKGVDWKAFADEVRQQLKGRSFYLKKSLRMYE